MFLGQPWPRGGGESRRRQGTIRRPTEEGLAGWEIEGERWGRALGGKEAKGWGNGEGGEGEEDDRLVRPDCSLRQIKVQTQKWQVR